MKDGGYLVPDSAVEDIRAALDRWWEAKGLVPPSPAPPLTVRQRLKVRWYLARMWVHDLLFPDCTTESDW